MQLVKRVRTFLASHWDGKSPLLLGYSGGPDSKALLYALLEVEAPIHLAHVDHGWREESASEANALQDEARSLKIPFHSVRLTQLPEKNIEDFGRVQRLQFFRSLFAKTPFQALLLAHQADDLAETALKRVFEGARLAHLSGMTDRCELEEMVVWRPLLHTTKREIFAYLEKKSLVAFLDHTNADPRFLRGRMRALLLPTLEESFGKKIAGNLAVLSERSAELREYLDRKTDPLWKSREEGPWGVRIDLNGCERIEARHLLHRFDLSRDALETLLDALEEGAPNFQSGGLYADRGWAYRFSDTPPRFDRPIQIREGRFTSGDWIVEIERSDLQVAADERAIWSGRFETSLPDGTLEEGGYLGRLPAPIRRRIIFPSRRQTKAPFFWKVRFSVSATQ